MRTQVPPPKGGRRIPAPQCEVSGCTESTRERKPYCTAHVHEHSYVRDLLGQLESIDQEIKAVKRRGARAVDLAGHMASDLLGFLRDKGPRSVPRLARDLNQPVSVVEGYVRALTRAGRVVTSRTDRGTLRVDLQDAPLAAIVSPGASFAEFRVRAG